MDSMYIKHGISLEDYPLDYVKAVKELFEMYSSSDFDMLLQIIEYLSNNLTAEDEAKNELLLTTTAMRISKLDMLAKGLVNEQREAVTENKISLAEHSKKLKADKQQISEKLKIDLDIESIAESFDDIKKVTDTGSLFEDINVPELKPIEVIEKPTDTKNTLGSGVDSFFD